MEWFRTVGAVIIMVIAAAVGFFAGAALDDAMGGMILFAVIAGFGCTVYAIDNHGRENKQLKKS